MMYVLRLKSSNERVDAIQAPNLDQAKEFFIRRKQMDEAFFNAQYTVSELRENLETISPKVRAAEQKAGMELTERAKKIKSRGAMYRAQQANKKKWDR